MRKFITTLLCLFMLVAVMGASVIGVAAQDEEEPESVTLNFTEEQINARLAEREGQFSWIVDFEESVAELSTTIERNDNVFNVVIIIIGATGGEGMGGGIFNAIDFEVTDADGNPLENVPQRAIDAGLMEFERVMRGEIRSLMDASSPLLALSSVLIQEDTVSVEFMMGDESERGFNIGMPPNVTENEDGTLTVSITEDMLNEAMTAISDRRENILSLTAQIDGFTVEIEGVNAGLLDFNIGMPPTVTEALCNNEIIEGTVVFVVDHKADDIADIVFADSGEPLTCGDTILPERPSQRIIAILIAFMDRYVRLQTRGGEVIDYELAPGVIELLIMPPQRPAGEPGADNDG